MTDNEKTHTPTDDEREALASIIQSGRYSGNVFPASNPIDFRDADRILAAGFRRSVVPEPSTEEPDLPNGHAPIEKLSPFLARRIVPTPEGPTDAQQAVALLDAMNAEGRIIYADYSRLHDLISSSEPQGEPSDAQVIAALNAWGNDRSAKLADWHPEKIEAMRAALRAAGVAGAR